MSDPKDAKEATSASAATEDEDEPSLSKLLAALAQGARAVHNLPLNDEYDYQSSFPEFSQLAKDTNDRLVQVLGVALPDLDSDDPELWEKIADACDSLLEQAETYAASDSGSSIPETLQNFSQKARQKAKSGYGRMMAGLVDMEKPQDSFGIHVQNDRTQPFVPRVHPDKPYSKVPLDMSLKDGHGLESRYYGTTRAVPPNIVAPSQHVPHVYQEELLSLEYRPWQLQAPTTKPAAIVKIPVENLTATWVDTKQELEKLARRLESVNMVAIDLEAHSYRSFSGLTCLMQITLPGKDGNENYLVDTLKLWNDINTYLAPVFANPDIVKVMHGADSDVQWLQRDFGIYVVNLFDTGRAARALKSPSAALAHLLQHYVGVEADKTHQLSDWRQRPLPSSMQTYAIMDTHYLLDIYQHLLWDLEKHPDASIEQVLNDSRGVCLTRYGKEPFQPDGYKSIRPSRRKTRTELTPQQEQVLASLYDWRDQTARDCDESIQYVCGNQALLRISMACPTTVATLQSLLNPMPPLVMRFSQDILSRIKQCLETKDGDEEDAEIPSPDRASAGAPSSAFFKPAEVDEVEDREDILSPVLATEEMYKQAGWMTPQVADVVTTTTDEDEGDSSSKPRKLLVVDDANKGYQSKEFTTHSLAMGKGGRGRTTDGLGPARAAGDMGDAANVDEEAKRAQLDAVRIRSGMSQDEVLLGLISPTAELEEVTGSGGREGHEDETNKENADVDSDEDFVIPKSMKEIYKISNRNRRNRNSISPTNLERSGGAPEHMEVDTLEGAEAVLAASGHYGPGELGKRQRNSPPSREENIEFMKGLGWIKSKEELEAMLERPREEAAEDASDTMGEENVDRESPADGESRASKGSSAGKPNKSGSPFDYSNIGPIGVYNPNAPPSSNPFFAGAAAVAPASTTQTTTTKGPSSSRKKGGRGKSGRGGKQERPEKKDGRTAVYKKR